MLSVWPQGFDNNTEESWLKSHAGCNNSRATSICRCQDEEGQTCVRFPGCE